MLKPPVAVFNPRGIRPGRLRVAWLLGDGSGTTATNIAEAWKTLGNGTITSPVWGSDADGSYLDLTGGGYITGTAVGADTLIPDWTIAWKFIGPSAAATNRTAWAIGTNPNAAQGGLQCNRVSGTTTYRAAFRDLITATLHTVEWTDVDFGVEHTMIVSGGQGGFRGWMDGVAGAQSAGAATYRGCLRIPSGQAVNVGRNPTTALTSGAIFKGWFLWDCELKAHHRDRLLGNWYCVGYEPPGKTAELAATAVWTTGAKTKGQVVKASSSANELFECTTAGTAGGGEPTWDRRPSKTTVDGSVVWTCRTPSYFGIWTCVPVGEPRSDKVKIQQMIARWKQTSSTVYLHYRQATTIAGLSAAQWVTAGSATTAESVIEYEPSGLSSGTRYYYNMGWSIDGSTIYPFPHGFGTFVTQRTAAADHKILVFGDRHWSQGAGGIAPDTLGDLTRIAYESDGSVSADNGRRSRMAGMKTVEYAMDQWLNFDFYVLGGDHVMSNMDSETTTDDTNSDQAQIWRSFGSSMCDVITSGAGFLLLGNHECTVGHHQNNKGALQKRALLARLKHWPNPNHLTYPEGGEAGNTYGEWVAAANRGTNIVVTAYPLENFWGMTWGGWRHTFQDTGFYSRVGDAFSEEAPSYRHFRQGQSQRTWWDGVNRMPFDGIGRINWRHHMFGGIDAGQDTAGGEYGRGMPIYLYDGRRDSDEMYVQDQLDRFNYTLDELFHDHKFTHGLRNGVHSKCGGNCGTPSHTQLTDDVGWIHDEIATAHGTAQSNGALDATGRPLRSLGLVNHYNAIGYALLEMTGTGAYWTVYQTCVQTAPVALSESDIEKYLLQWNATAGQSWGERWLANQTHALDGSDRLSLIDSLNAAPVPQQVYGVYDDPAGDWWTGALTQQWSGYMAAAIVANGTVTYTVGDCVTPTIPNGWLYKCTARTGACNAEPTHNGTAATDWPNVIGVSITVGNTTWQCTQRQPIHQFDGAYDSTLQATVAAGADVRPVYAPRIIYRPFLSLNTRSVAYSPEVGRAFGVATPARAIAFMGGGRP